MSDDQKRMFLAVVLSGLVLFGWQTYFAPKQKPIIEQNASEQINAKAAAKTQETTVKQEVVKPVTESVSSEVKSFTLTNNGHSVKINSDLSIQDFSNPGASFDFFATTGVEKPFKIEIGNEARFSSFNFTFNQVSPSHIQGSNVKLAMNVDFKMDDLGKVTYKVTSAKAYQFRVVFTSTEREEENRQIRQFSYYTQSLNHMKVGDSDDDDGKMRWLAIDFNFHLFAITFKEPVAARLKAFESGEFRSTLVNDVHNLEGSIVFSKKNYDLLAKLGDKLDLSIDFGFFGIISVPILRGLQFVHDYVPNYGIAIIILTILIRTIMFPLQYKSFKSMKKMQKIQPQLTKIKEKFKDDPQRMQKETMEAFKKAGANPLGGCLPLIAQMPIFFAFYQVLYNAEEFVGSPFFGWIADLSIKDPYYVLPVLMALAMALQTRLNPSPSADPTQKKIMMLMPIVFGFFMKDLPAGLNLYIFTSTIYGVGQQLLVYKLTD
ncbi:membrane protein OxaA [Halobacteriovorax marinus SJ]|uniref:Membrane protein insertase YidC n=1 Tax=Halobacteriovorax marinus (strain ATCC BAA-682 / DSM 15412 / SJ) TaxID=862908 RepID=E1X1M1_HALMS|nr:membrane protein insertase YidC [Halobacteriovorax marinus]CBW28189.1 membrane protein OxaA [Halobacteriovorax marinus SJ]